jgi:hypothetical protein
LNYNLKIYKYIKKMTDNTQLTSASGYDTKNMIFSEAQAGTIPNSVPQINYKRINIQTRNKDGSAGELVLSTNQLFSFGVSENTNPDTGKVNGYVMPLCLWNRDGASKEEKEWSDTFDAIVERCKSHLIEKREDIEQYDLTMSDLKKFNPLYYKKEKGKVVEGTGPTLYAKLIVSKKQDKIVTMFYDSEGTAIDALTLIGKYCFAKCAVKIESIFIGNKICLQVKLYECEVKPMDSGIKRLLKRPTAQTTVLTSNSAKPMDESKLDDDAGSVHDSDDEGAKPKPAPKLKPKPVEADQEDDKQKKVVKKVVRKVVRKDNE